MPKRKWIVTPSPRKTPKKDESSYVITPFSGSPALPIIKYTNTGVGIRGHGNYCGPNWSAGKFQGSVSGSSVPPVDALDSECMAHDGVYATSGDLAAADIRFARRTIGMGVKGTMFGLLVGAQGIARKLGLIGRTGTRIDVPDDSFFPVIETGVRKMALKKRSRKSPIRRKCKFAKRKAGKYTKKTNKKSYRYGRRRVSKSRKLFGNKRNLVTYKYENGGSKTDGAVTAGTAAVYVGHGCATYHVVTSIFMSMVKELFISYGVQFKNWEEVAIDPAAGGTSLSVSLYWTLGEDSSTLQNSHYDIAAGANYKAIADNLQSKFLTDVQATWTVNNVDAPVLQKLVLRTGTNATPDYELARCDLKVMRVNVNYQSSFRMQNRTKANSTAVGESTANTDVVNNNPCEVTMYYGKYNRNFFPVKSTYGIAAATKFSPDSQKGWISSDATSLGNSFKESVDAGTVGAYKAKKMILHPGQVLVDTWKYGRTMSLNWLLHNLMQSLAVFSGTNPPTTYNYGYTRMFCFEKLVSDRTELNPVDIGFEIDYTINLSLKKTVVKGMAFNNVN